MFQRFDEESRKVLKKAKIEMQDMKHPFVGTEHFMLSILKNKDLNLTMKLNEYNIYYDNFKEKLIKLIGIGNSLNNCFIYTPLLKRIIENAILDTREEGKVEVNLNSLFLSLLDEGEGVAIRILNDLGVDIDEMYLDFVNIDESPKYKNKKKSSIYEYGIDLVKLAMENKIDPVIGRDKEINRMIEILLRRTKNNPLLIGEAGVGKTAIVEGLALRISKNEVPEKLLNKKIISLSLSSLVAGTKYRGEFEDKVNKIIKELESNPDIILFIDEIHSLVGAGGAEGAIYASNIFKPALARGKLKMIGATTINEYKESIAKDKALERRFQTTIIKEPNYEETKNILMKLKPIYENYHQVIVPETIIDNIIKLADKYIFNRKNPDKTIDILDEVCISRSLIKDKNTKKIEDLQQEYNLILENKNNYLLQHDFFQASSLKKQELLIESKINELKLTKNNNLKKEVTLKDVALVIKNKTNIPVYEIENENNNLLKKLENMLNEEIIGQEEVIKILCFETKKLKLGLKNTCRPLSFLFTGKSGVGKTELVKQYAKLLDMPLIRIDGSEYKESHTTSKILGSPPGYVGYNDHNSILEDIKNNPYSIILLDEIEKVNQSVLNLFLQILDEGFITNSSGEKVYFNHTIIFMTSNLTSNVKSIGFNQNNKVIKDKLEEGLSLEFINRINHIMQFNNLNEDIIKKIINKQVKLIKKKYANQDIILNISSTFINDILKLSNYETSGARNIKNLVEDKIDNLVIDNLLIGNKNIKIKL